MTHFNQISTSIESAYQQGLLPQRNHKGLFYADTSCRSSLANLKLSSENRRILKKTSNYTYSLASVSDFDYNISVQKTIHHWISALGWDFPTSSVRTVFTNHIFNNIYTWKDHNDNTVAYSVCYFSSDISHIGYVFYHPDLSHSDLPIRLVLQFVIDSASKNLKYAYLGRFSPDNGYYKRNMPNFQYFYQHQWQNL